MSLRQQLIDLPINIKYASNQMKILNLNIQLFGSLFLKTFKNLIFAKLNQNSRTIIQTFTERTTPVQLLVAYK